MMKVPVICLPQPRAYLLACGACRNVAANHSNPYVGPVLIYASRARVDLDGYEAFGLERNKTAHLRGRILAVGLMRGSVLSRPDLAEASLDTLACEHIWLVPSVFAVEPFEVRPVGGNVDVSDHIFTVYTPRFEPTSIQLRFGKVDQPIDVWLKESKHVEAMEVPTGL